MKTKTLKSLMLILLAIVPTMLSAQAEGIRISGVVTSADGPLMMCNVVEIDANNRNVSFAQTDFNGNFSMMILNPKNKLSVSYVGYKTFTQVIGNTRKFTIMMKDDTMIEEVVVTAVKKYDHGGMEIPENEVSGASQRFNMSEVEGLAFTTVDEALQGQIAGLDIVSNSGNLGAGTSMRLRGITSINGNSEPLIVVDGNIFDNPDENFDFESANEESYAALLSVNPGDIEEINVLKDAASTAIYGARGSNGVISIKTKRGSRGKTRVDYSLRLQTNWQPKGYNLLSGDDYTMMMKEMYYNPTQSPNATMNINELNYNSSWAEWENWNENTDWVGAVTQTSLSQYHYLTITGGGEKATFRVSAGYDHQNGTMIEQRLDRFSTKLTLDYFVSDRITFRTTFPLTYTYNERNAEGLLGIAQKLAPNMSIYRQDAQGNNTDEYYIMLPSGGNDAVGSTIPNTSANQLKSIRDLGNPVAIAYLATDDEQTYRISPEFKIDYHLLGLNDDEHRLRYSGSVYMDIYSNNTHRFIPGSLRTNNWTDGNYNFTKTSDSGRMQLSTKHQLVYNPVFPNRDWTSSMMVQGELRFNQSTSQNVETRNLPNGITVPTVGVLLSNLGTGNGEGRDMNALYTGHLAYKSRYILDFTVRADGTTRFGASNKWGYFPSVSARWNITDEPFMEWTRPVLTYLSFRPTWGIVGSMPGSEYLQYTRYNTDGRYGNGGNKDQSVTYLEGLQLNNLKWERTTQYNIGGDFAFFNNILQGDFNYYYKRTNDMLMSGVKIPGTTGFGSLSNANVGEMSNRGWELNMRLQDVIKVNDFRASFNFNVSQNFNRIEALDENVLADKNKDWEAGNRGAYLLRIQVGNPLGSIFGFRSLGVYQYSYEWLMDQRGDMTVDQFRDYINEFLASGKTAPVATDEHGKVLINRNGNPVQLKYDYEGIDYDFKGGDAMYEDINHDGQINAQDIIYLGNSNPKLSGGFGVSLNYKRWSARANFSYRYGFMEVNRARMNLEKMYDANNQSTAVNFRWRQNGDETKIPRAMYNTAYNWLGSSRYVEDGSYVRMSYFQLSYNFPSSIIKAWGLNRLSGSLSVQNPFVWSKYSGTDPEHGYGAFGIAEDNSQTPRSKSVTLNFNVGF